MYTTDLSKYSSWSELKSDWKRSRKCIPIKNTNTNCITETATMSYTTPSATEIAHSTESDTYTTAIMDANQCWQPISPFYTDINKIPEKGTTMSKYETYGPLASEAEKQRAHLLERLSSIFYDKEKDLRILFRLDQDRPKTLKDLISRIKKDEFTYKKEDLEKIHRWQEDLFFALDWRTEPADQPGFDKAVEDMRAAKKAAQDEIIVSDPKAGLEVLRKFEDQKFG